MSDESGTVLNKPWRQETDEGNLRLERAVRALVWPGCIGILALWAVAWCFHDGVPWTVDFAQR